MTEIQAEATNAHLLKHRFRGYFPVIIDVETAGFNAKTDALLELAAITVKMNEDGLLVPDQTCHFHIEPFVGLILTPSHSSLMGLIFTIHYEGQSVKQSLSQSSSKWFVKHKKQQTANALLSWHTMRPLIKVS